jgi:hypothetical protein
MWRNTAEVPVLNSFTQAKQRFEMTKPIRGHKEQRRPLGSRRHHHMASIEMPDADTVVLKYCGEPFVTWKSDDSFTVSNGVYNSAYTAQHLSFFLPMRWEVKWNGCRMTIGNKGKFYIIPFKAHFHFAKAGEDYELVDKPTAYAIRKKRGSDKNLLEKCKPFFDWLSVVSSINGVVTTAEIAGARDVLIEQSGVKPFAYYKQRMEEAQKNPAAFSDEARLERYADYRMFDSIPATTTHYMYLAYRSFHTPSCERLIEWVESDNADNWVLAMNLLSERTGRRRWVDGEVQYQVEINQVTKYLLDVARHTHRDTVFYKEQLDDGVVPSRSNAVYFRSHSFSV